MGGTLERALKSLQFRAIPNPGALAALGASAIETMAGEAGDAPGAAILRTLWRVSRLAEDPLASNGRLDAPDEGWAAAWCAREVETSLKPVRCALAPH